MKVGVYTTATVNCQPLPASGVIGLVSLYQVTEAAACSSLLPSVVPN